METKRINIEVVKDTWKKVGAFASENETTKKDILNAALNEYLNRRGIE